MIPVPTGVKVWLATGHTDMRKGFPGLSLMVQEALRRAAIAYRWIGSTPSTSRRVAS